MDNLAAECIILRYTSKPDSVPVGHSIPKVASNVFYCIDDELIETEMYLAES